MIQRTYEQAYPTGASLKATVVLLLIAISPACKPAASAEIGVEEIVFACRQPGAGGHWYENFGYYALDKSEKAYRAKGRLCRLNLGSGALTVLLDAPEGSIRDPQVHYNGADINAGHERWGGSAIYYASRGGHEDVVRLLIDRGADLPLVDLFFSAVRRGQKELVEFLIKKGVDVNIKDDYWGDAPSLYAVWGKWGNQTDVLELLLSHGADANAKDRWDWSLLHYAAGYGYTDITRMLLDKGADANNRDNEWGRTPLHYAAEEGHRTVVELLISQGANVNEKDYDGQTPLSLAKEKGHSEVFELLSKHGAKE